MWQEAIYCSWIWFKCRRILFISSNTEQLGRRSQKEILLSVSPNVLSPNIFAFLNSWTVCYLQVLRTPRNNSVRVRLRESRPLCLFACIGMRLQKFCPGRKFLYTIIEHAILALWFLLVFWKMFNIRNLKLTQNTHDFLFHLTVWFSWHYCSVYCMCSSLGLPSQKYHRQSGLNSRHLFLTVLEAEKFKGNMLAASVCDVGPFPGLYRWLPFCYVPTWWRERNKLSPVSSHKGASPSPQGLKGLPKAPFPK